MTKSLSYFQLFRNVPEVIAVWFRGLQVEVFGNRNTLTTRGPKYVLCEHGRAEAGITLLSLVFSATKRLMKLRQSGKNPSWRKRMATQGSQGRHDPRLVSAAGNGNRFICTCIPSHNKETWRRSYVLPICPQDQAGSPSNSRQFLC